MFTASFPSDAAKGPLTNGKHTQTYNIEPDIALAQGEDDRRKGRQLYSFLRRAWP